MRPRSATAPTVLWLFLLGAILALFGVHAVRCWGFTPDAAGMSFTYARNLGDGAGLVVARGAERVEGVDNLLWCLLLAPARWTGLGIGLVAKSLGLLAGGVALVAIALFPSATGARRPAWGDLVAPLVAASLPLFALWCVSGLENALYAALLSTSLLALAREESGASPFPWSSAPLAALFATRPDAVLAIVAVGAAKLIRRRTSRPPRQDLAWLAVLALGIGGLELFRLAYFAWPLPNASYAAQRAATLGGSPFDPHGPGWRYIVDGLRTLGLGRLIFVLPLILLGVGEIAPRLALLGLCATALALPMYTRGDPMPAFRLLSLASPILALGIVEAARAPFQRVQSRVPVRHRNAFCIGSTALIAALVAVECIRFHPVAAEINAQSATSAFEAARRRAQSTVDAARALQIDGLPTLLDANGGGAAFDGRLTVIDALGLDDVSIAHAAAGDPTGARESIFGEQRPVFVHATEGPLTRLDEITAGYLALPARDARDEIDVENTWVRRDAIAAPWYVPATLAVAPGARRVGAYVDGWTLSHGGLEPGHRMAIEVTVANASTGDAGTLVLSPANGPAIEAALRPGDGVFAPSVFLPGERPRVRVFFTPPAGTYAITWRAATGPVVELGRIVVAAGAGAADAARVRGEMDREISAGSFGGALVIARTLGLRAVADPSDGAALDTLARFGRALADRAGALAAGGALTTASLVAREARHWAAFDARTVAATQSVAERLADEARGAERAGDFARAFELARDTVLTDPRRSWSRRRAEELRNRRVAVYDGGRDQAAYRMAAATLADHADPDDAILFLASVNRWIELAALADRLDHPPEDPRARVALARGRLSRGELTEALALVSGVPCAAAHDAELTRGVRALLGHAYRPGDAACERDERPPPDAIGGSFEQGSFAGWSLDGDAFGARPTDRAAPGQHDVTGQHGRYFANSFALGSDGSQGTLRSAAFDVRGEALSFLVGGGGDAARVGVRLTIDGRTVLQSTGEFADEMHRVFWDVRPYVGQRARIEVYDTSSAAWGHVLADDFRVEPVMPVAPEPPSPSPPR